MQSLIERLYMEGNNELTSVDLSFDLVLTDVDFRHNKKFDCSDLVLPIEMEDSVEFFSF